MSRDRGSATIEIAILAPAALTFFLVVMIASRFSIALQAADSVAYDAARTASLSRTAAEAEVNGAQAAAKTLEDLGLRCQSWVTDIDTSDFALDPGNTATVKADITCTILFSDLIMPGWDTDMFSTLTINTTFVSPLDTYRSRT
jgi:hypothetical protein